MSERSPKILIIGAGIGGLTAAVALRQSGCDVHVFERAKELKPGGAAVGLAPNAVRALDEIGLSQLLLRLGRKTRVLEVQSAGGNLLRSIGLSSLAEQVGSASVCITRTALQRLLLEACDEERVTLSARLERFDFTPRGVVARFADGREAEGDVLIGADGIHSKVRAQHVGDPLRTAGYLSWLGMAHGTRLPEGLNRWIWGRGLIFGLHDLGDDLVYWWATELGGSAPASDGKAHLAKLFAGWPKPIPDIVAATDAENIGRFEEHDRVPIARWGEGPVTLLGDAAHPMEPFLAQGACSAIEDGVAIARHLKRGLEPKALVAKLRAYEAERIPRTQFLVEGSRRNRLWQLKHPNLTKKFRIAFGPGLFTFAGEPWREIRQRQQPAFSREKINEHSAIYIDRAKKMLDRWPQEDEAVMDISKEMGLITLQVALEALFSREIDNGDAIFEAFEQMQRYSSRLNENLVTLPRWIPTRDNVAFNRAEKTFEQLTELLLRERGEKQQEKAEKQDLFNLIMAGAKRSGSQRSAREQIRGEITNTLFAGQDTVASNLVYVLQHLAASPDDVVKVEADIATLRGRPPRMEDVPKLEYVTCAINEALRMYPAAWIQQRCNIEEFEHKGYRIPKNSVLLLSTWIVHRSPALWNEPAAFRPERFSKENSKGRHRFAFYPFGGGARKCIGFHMAQYEVLFILTMIVQRYALLRPVNTAPPCARFTLQPESSIRIVVKAREKMLGT